MAFKPKPERVLHLETLLNGYRLNIDPLPREQAEKLGDSPDMVRVHPPPPPAQPLRRLDGSATRWRVPHGDEENPLGSGEIAPQKCG